MRSNVLATMSSQGQGKSIEKVQQTSKRRQHQNQSKLQRNQYLFEKLIILLKLYLCSLLPIILSFLLIYLTEPVLKIHLCTYIINKTTGKCMFCKSLFIYNRCFFFFCLSISLSLSLSFVLSLSTHIRKTVWCFVQKTIRTNQSHAQTHW